MKYFGTDGIREKAEWFNYERLGAICAGLVEYAESRGGDGEGADGDFHDDSGRNIKVLVGGDTRESGEWILQDLCTALEALGVEYASVGVLPTPAINYCFYEMGFDYAIDVTASHNPYTDNGIKIFERGAQHGQKLGAEGCAMVEKALADGVTVAPVAVTLREDLHDEAVELYCKHLKEYIEGFGGGVTDFSGLKIGLDCANGATSAINAVMFEGFGAEVSLINADMAYGIKINDGCGSTHLEKLTELVREKGLDFGAAFDGDGDRCLLVDATGEVVDGDEIIAILAAYLELDAAAVTVMANQGLLNWANANDVKLAVTPVGDSNVAAAMREQGIMLGGEQSGHIILPGEATGDGMLTALAVAKVVATSGRSLHDLASAMTKLPQVVVNLSANSAQKERFASLDATKDILAHFDEKVKGYEGRILVRPSGTEELIRITVWGNDLKVITELAEELKAELGDALK